MKGVFPIEHRGFNDEMYLSSSPNLVGATAILQFSGSAELLVAGP